MALTHYLNESLIMIPEVLHILKKVLSSLVCLAALASSSSTHGQQAKGSELFLIHENGKYGFIDKTGRIIIQPHFVAALSFSDGLAPVRIGETWGYINATGKVVI